MPVHLFLLTCKIPYHGALNSILYITGLDLMFPNANPTAPKLPFNPFSPPTPPFPLIFLLFSLFAKQDFAFFLTPKAAGFISRCNYIPRKFCSAITCLCRQSLPPLRASESFIPHLFIWMCGDKPPSQEPSAPTSVHSSLFSL